MNWGSRRRACLTLWHFNNLISNYIIKIYISTRISNVMDIRRNIYAYWLFTKLKAIGIYDSVSIILIESINLLRTVCWTKNSLTKSLFFRLNSAMIKNIISSFIMICSRSMIVKWLIQFSEKCATSPSHFAINNFFLYFTHKQDRAELFKQFCCIKTCLDTCLWGLRMFPIMSIDF